MRFYTRLFRPSGSEASLHREQIRFGIGLFGLAIVVLALADLSAYRDIVPAALDAMVVKRWSRSRGQQSAYIGTFGDHERRLLFEELPNAYYPAGSVVLLGGSNLQRGMMLWKLPQSERVRLHNYALSSVTFLQEYQLLRFLVDEGGLLDGGAGNITVVFGLYFGNAVPDQPAPAKDFLPKIAEITGLYTWQPVEGLQRLQTSAIERVARTEWARARSFFYYAGRMWHFLEAAPNTLQHRPDAYRDYWAWYMTPRVDPSSVRRPYAVFSEALDYLNAKGIRARAVLLPVGSWFDGFKFADSFRREVEGICQTKGVPLADLSHLLSDDEFTDSAHYNYPGQVKFQDALLRLIAQPE